MVPYAIKNASTYENPEKSKYFVFYTFFLCLTLFRINIPYYRMNI